MLDFFKGKNVFITGHTGFKGAWLSKIMLMAGARLSGYSLEPDSGESLYHLLKLSQDMNSVIGDIRDIDSLNKALKEAKPEIVLHLAAQPLVRASYEDPVYTYATNVMGTVNLLDCLKAMDSVKSVLNVTTDKVYENKEWVYGYRECDNLNGYDPYSNSKSCSELVTHSYKKAFFDATDIAVSTARAGNVIGGGDFSKDRIIPDCVKAAGLKKPIIVRNPNSTRPYQHVLEPLAAYLLILKSQNEDRSKEGVFNVGPEDADCVTTGILVDIFCKTWGEGMTWENVSDGGPHEANFLKLDCSKIKAELDWKPVLNIEEAVKLTVEWYKAYEEGSNYIEVIEKQIKAYFKEV